MSKYYTLDEEQDCPAPLYQDMPIGMTSEDVENIFTEEEYSRYVLGNEPQKRQEFSAEQIRRWKEYMSEGYEQNVLNTIDSVLDSSADEFDKMSNERYEKTGISGFDFDGVISIGINPGPNDIIITGRSFEEAHYVYDVLAERGLKNPVYFNTMRKEGRKREDSGVHKADIIQLLEHNGIKLEKFFEDDPIQIAEIKAVHPDLPIVHVSHDLVEK